MRFLNSKEIIGAARVENRHSRRTSSVVSEEVFGLDLGFRVVLAPFLPRQGWFFSLAGGGLPRWGLLLIGWFLWLRNEANDQFFDCLIDLPSCF